MDRYAESRGLAGTTSPAARRAAAPLHFAAPVHFELDEGTQFQRRQDDGEQHVHDGQQQLLGCDVHHELDECFRSQRREAAERLED